MSGMMSQMPVQTSVPVHVCLQTVLQHFTASLDVSNVKMCMIGLTQLQGH